ncbi:MAG: hypothetical protein K6T83_00360 [Alicyclobacillus sp.]|nr:hypothetical protein [Alicyclobacillus sp.]
MSRLVHRAVEVTENQVGEPVAFVDGQQRYTVMLIQDRWVEAGEWWNGETQRTIYRVLTTDTGHGIGLYDLERTEGQWRIYRVWD